MGQMSNRSSNRPKSRFLGSFRSFAHRLGAVGSFRNFTVGSFRKSSLEHLELFADYFHQGAECVRKILEILRADQSRRERIGAVFLERRSPLRAQQ
jgi:hypothetical protein